MGANNSIPKTAEFINPSPDPNFIIITQQVSSRIEDARRKDDPSPPPPTIPSPAPYICNNCIKEKEKKSEKPKGTILSAYQKKLLEIENYNYEEKLKELEKAAYKPSNWKEENKETLQSMESDLLNCYKKHPGEPLQCHANAKEYQKFVFDGQFKNILKHTQAAGDNANQEIN